MISLYIHIPFCATKCRYCDFISWTGEEEYFDAYLDRLLQELEEYSDLCSSGISTVYLGGGTPTIFGPHRLQHLLSRISLLPGISFGRTEVTIEANPGTLDKETLDVLADSLVTRISLGAQSFTSSLLSLLGRSHSPKEISSAFFACRQRGIFDINIDLMFALPGQTLAEWKYDLSSCIALLPDHISLYNLEVTEGTPLWNAYHHKEESEDCIPPLPDNEVEAEMYEYAINTLLSHGYRQYEISNFSLPGKECRHNLTYWTCGEYLGIGVAAHSYIRGKRWANLQTLSGYLAGISPVEEESSPEKESLFLGLRLLRGVEREKFSGYEKIITSLAKRGLITETEARIHLTRKGLLFANEVFREFV